VVSMELWGKALLLVVKRASMPLSFAASVLDGALREATGRLVVCVMIAESETEARFLVLGPKGAQRVNDWVGQGVLWGDILTKLHTPSRASAGGAV